jgi:hypothetical protein
LTTVKESEIGIEVLNFGIDKEKKSVDDNPNSNSLMQTPRRSTTVKMPSLACSEERCVAQGRRDLPPLKEEPVSMELQPAVSKLSIQPRSETKVIVKTASLNELGFIPPNGLREQEIVGISPEELCILAEEIILQVVKKPQIQESKIDTAADSEASSIHRAPFLELTKRDTVLIDNLVDSVLGSTNLLSTNENRESVQWNSKHPIVPPGASKMGNARNSLLQTCDIPAAEIELTSTKQQFTQNSQVPDFAENFINVSSVMKREAIDSSIAANAEAWSNSEPRSTLIENIESMPIKTENVTNLAIELKNQGTLNAGTGCADRAVMAIAIKQPESILNTKARMNVSMESCNEAKIEANKQSINRNTPIVEIPVGDRSEKTPDVDLTKSSTVMIFPKNKKSVSELDKLSVSNITPKYQTKEGTEFVSKEPSTPPQKNLNIMSITPIKHPREKKRKLCQVDPHLTYKQKTTLVCRASPERAGKSPGKCALDVSKKQGSYFTKSNRLVCSPSLITHPSVLPEQNRGSQIIESILQISQRELEIDVSISPSSDSKEHIVISTQLTQTDCNAIYEIQPDHLTEELSENMCSNLILSSPIFETVKNKVEVSKTRTTPPHLTQRKEPNFEVFCKVGPLLEVNDPFPSSFGGNCEIESDVGLTSHLALPSESKNDLTLDIPKMSISRKIKSSIAASDSDSNIMSFPLAKRKNEIMKTSCVNCRAHPLLLPYLNHIPSPYSSLTESSESCLGSAEREFQSNHSAEDRALFLSKYEINSEVFDLCKTMAITNSEEL